nr:uncharacterized protein CTRU02_07620 [Colletotrichum truncatum]KAF6791280.1 hypothetical protein CTRU02_07620 [Colletotrichum truncatum]
MSIANLQIEQAAQGGQGRPAGGSPRGAASHPMLPRRRRRFRLFPLTFLPVMALLLRPELISLCPNPNDAESENRTTGIRSPQLISTGGRN